MAFQYGIPTEIVPASKFANAGKMSQFNIDLLNALNSVKLGSWLPIQFDTLSEAKAKSSGLYSMRSKRNLEIKTRGNVLYVRRLSESIN